MGGGNHVSQKYNAHKGLCYVTGIIYFLSPTGTSTPENILLVEDLWDSIVSDESSVPVPRSHIKELDQRLKRYASHPGELLSLEALESRVERRTRQKQLTFSGRPIIK